MYNAYANANRKKGKPPIKLWKRRGQRKSKKDYNDITRAILNYEAKDPDREFFKRLQKGSGK